MVAETWDGWLNDANAHSIEHKHVFAAMDSAQGGPVVEGCVGGGTGMICYDFKGGIGSSSRVVRTEDGAFVVGVLVQSNHGSREGLRVNGIPVGVMIGKDRMPMDWHEPADQANIGSSIIIVIGTDAPLIPTQCNRLAQRATVGLARTGGMGYNGSGDLFLCFSTGNHVSEYDTRVREIRMLAHRQLNAFFEAAAEAVEEAIINSLVAAETMTGFQGHTVHALPHDALVQALIGSAR